MLRRFVIYAVTFLALASHAAALLHWAVIQHETCAAHGDLVHGGHGREATSHETTASATSSVDQSDDAEAHEHDHCSATATAAESFAELHQLAVSVKPTHALDVWSIVAVRCDARLLLLFAPKTSPPSALQQT